MIEHSLHDAVVQIDHRPLGYEPMGKADLIALYRTGLDDDTLRAVPVYGTIFATNERAAVLRGGLWLRAGSGDYWLGNPYMLVIGSSDRGMASADIFAEDALDAAMARFEELSAREPASDPPSG